MCVLSAAAARALSLSRLAHTHTHDSHSRTLSDWFESASPSCSLTRSLACSPLPLPLCHGAASEVVRREARRGEVLALLSQNSLNASSFRLAIELKYSSAFAALRILFYLLLLLPAACSFLGRNLKRKEEQTTARARERENCSDRVVAFDFFSQLFLLLFFFAFLLLLLLIDFP